MLSYCVGDGAQKEHLQTRSIGMDVGYESDNAYFTDTLLFKTRELPVSTASSEEILWLPSFVVVIEILSLPFALDSLIKLPLCFSLCRSSLVIRLCKSEAVTQCRILPLIVIGRTGSPWLRSAGGCAISTSQSFPSRPS